MSLTPLRRVSALTVLLAVCGCAPSNLQECMDAATAKPTDAGVRIAAHECRKRFASFDYASAQPAPSPPNQFEDLIPKPAEPDPEPAWWETVKEWILGLTMVERAVIAALGFAIPAALKKW